MANLKLSAALLFASASLLIAAFGAADTAAAHVGNGYRLEQEDRFEEAAQEFRQALQLDPSLVRARYQYAVCLFATGQNDAARKEFERVSAESSGDAAVVYYLARLDLLVNDYAAAISKLRSVVEQPPFPDTAFYLGVACLGSGGLTEGIAWLERAARLAPRDFRVHYRLARAYSAAGRQADAKREYEQFTGLREGYNEGARQSLACSEALRSQPIKQARGTCRWLFDPNDPDKLTLLGIVFGNNGAYAEAIEPLERAARLDPDSFEIFYNLGLTYFRLRRFAAAREPLEKAVALRPDYFGSNALLGATLYALKDDDAAYKALEHAIRLNPQHADTESLLCREAVLLGRKMITAARYADAAAYFRKAVELQPGNSDVHRNLAEAYRLLGRNHDAVREQAEADRLSTARK